MGLMEFFTILSINRLCFNQWPVLSIFLQLQKFPKTLVNFVIFELFSKIKSKKVPKIVQPPTSEIVLLCLYFPKGIP